MDPQVTELETELSPAAVEPIANPAPPRDDDHVLEWLLDGGYNGNKPLGGLWTSSYTPLDEYISDWQRGRKTNAVVQHAYPANIPLRAYLLLPATDARVLTIRSFDEAMDFTWRYRRRRLRLPSKVVRHGLGLLVTDELTDWERALSDYDGIRITAAAMDEVWWQITNDGSVTAFHTWNCESCIWGRWAFEGFDLIEVPG